jgi:hypothetical protein
MKNGFKRFAKRVTLSSNDPVYLSDVVPKISLIAPFGRIDIFGGNFQGVLF